MRITHKQNGFTIIEMLMALVILAMVMTAMAVALDASVINFKANESISKTSNAARAALLRMTTELRTAAAVATIGVGSGFDPADLSKCSLTAVDPDGSTRNIAYRFSAADHILYLDSGGNSYPLCKNVAAATFNRAIVPASNPVAVRNVRIVLTLTDDKGANPRIFAAAAVIRKNLN
ncbi:MAG: prepilin-type N-terminal cleavage/methylation domain-containing protein [Planctomycetes bacterium]|nr:prepilin-type N-terminal cleavage/methylation domain-containing protein [Planctomycetota bacterium]